MHCAHVALIACRVGATRRNASQSDVLPIPASPSRKRPGGARPRPRRASKPVHLWLPPDNIGTDELAAGSAGASTTGAMKISPRLTRLLMKRGRIGWSPSPPDLPDEHLDVVGVDVNLGPNRGEQVLLGDQVAGPLDEDGEDVEGLVRQRDPDVIPQSVRPGTSSLKGAKYFTLDRQL